MKRLATALILISSVISPVIATSAQASGPVICLAYDTGGPGDSSFNDAAQAGLKVAAGKFDFTLQTTVTSGDAKDRTDRLTALVKKDCTIVIAVGTGYAETLKELSKEFPETQFAILNDASVDALNVTSIVFADVQGAYLAGYAAALASKSNKVAMVGYASQKELYDKGFAPGAKAARKSVTTSIKFISSSATSVTSTLLRSGHDVIYLTTTGSATEVFDLIAASNKASKNRSVGIITVEPDQFLSVEASTKKFVLATVVKRVDLALIDLLTNTLSGGLLYDEVDPVLGVYGHRYGISDKGIEITLRSPALVALTAKINAASAVASKLSN
ncbi:MAG: BMP family protein [Candidatus Planktophila sp.]